MTRLLFALLAAIVVSVMACGGGNDSTAQSTATAAAVSSSSVPARPTLPPVPTRAPQPTSTPVTTYDRSTRTGIPVIDAALDALASGDATALMAQLSFHPYRCNSAPAGVDGANPCPPGVPDGSPVDVVALGGCDVSFLARDRAGLLADLQSFEDAAGAQGVYAVTEVAPGRLSSPLPLRYLIILSGGYSLLLDDSGITHLGLPCEGVGPREIFHPADRPILPPL